MRIPSIMKSLYPASRLVTLRTRIGSITRNIETSKDILESQVISNKERRSYLIDSDVAELADMVKQESILKTAYKQATTL